MKVSEQLQAWFEADETTDEIFEIIENVKKLEAQVSEMSEDVALLCHLRAQGVDNWDGYSHPDDSADEDYPVIRD